MDAEDRREKRGCGGGVGGILFFVFCFFLNAGGGGVDLVVGSHAW